jgi:hypothetical protein
MKKKDNTVLQDETFEVLGTLPESPPLTLHANNILNELLTISLEGEVLVRIDVEGTVTKYRKGADKEAAKQFWDCIQFEGKTLLDQIKELKEENEALKLAASTKCND